MGVMTIVKTLGDIIGFARTMNDSQQRRERYELLLDKKAKKALNSGETIIHGIDSYLAGSITLKQFKYIFKKHKKIFFDND